MHLPHAGQGPPDSQPTPALPGSEEDRQLLRKGEQLTEVGKRIRDLGPKGGFFVGPVLRVQTLYARVPQEPLPLDHHEGAAAEML